jgi:hypothetical protein
VQDNTSKANISRSGNNFVYDFPDSQGLITETDPPCKDSRSRDEPIYQRPASFRFVPKVESTSERVLREAYEERVRSAFRHGHTIEPVKLEGSEYSVWEGLDAAARRTEAWNYELGNSRVIYGPKAPETHGMKRAFRVSESRKFFYAKNAFYIKQGLPLLSVTNYKGSFYFRDKKFLPIGIIRSGTDMTQQFVGSYCIDIYPNSNNSITFVLSNTTSEKSALYGVGREYPRGTVGRRGNTINIYTWTEQIPVLKDAR